MATMQGIRNKDMGGETRTITCGRCLGKGKIGVKQDSGTVLATCPHCRGTGKVTKRYSTK